ncbi:MAG: FAD-dependent oxidoreductase [Candidatus Caenarcaniphilales bacterium]|nr:FAD-dependent oxidoreductase [Candidatus Caenarcaniphilales bacterium]
MTNNTKNQVKKILVIGAGLAGLAASKKLIDAGFEVTLLESRTLIGGKVSAWKDKDGHWIESGLHVFFGSYRKIFELMKEVGIYENVDWQSPSIQYKMPGGKGFQIVSNEHLPCPLNLLPNFFFSHQFSITDLLNYCRAIIPILKRDLDYINAQDNKNFLEWVNEFKVSEDMVKRMFLPMTLSLKFLPTYKISAQVVLNVFRLFISDPKGFKIGFLNGSPAEKLTGPIAEYLQKKGAKLHLNQKIEALEFIDASNKLSGLKAVKTASGDVFEADYFVFALPTHKYKEVLSPNFEGIDYFENLKNFSGVPVANAQFWFDRPITKDRRLHFGTGSSTPVFADMNLACKDYRTKNGGSMIETVVAPIENFEQISDEELLSKALSEIQSYFPDSKNAKLLKSSLVKIPQSVYAPLPGLEALRPSQSTPVKNLFLAGGFTKGHEFFDSMEGAVQGGTLAAKALIKYEKENSSVVFEAAVV